MASQKESLEPDIHDENRVCVPEFNGVLLRPVSAGESGEGLPYAPINWPNPGDNWRWKVGKRKSGSGFYCDRYLYPPSSLQNTLQKKQSYPSKYAVERYIRNRFPNADVDAFFASFCWKIPSANHSWEKGKVTPCSMLPEEEMVEYSGSDSNSGTMSCKAGNKMCNLTLQTRTCSPAAMDCDVCCSEPGFCRDCCCILCTKTVDWAYGGYSVIRCEGKVSEEYICGHVAHIDCALRSYMAGTVGGSIGLEAEYYCRRCDKRTDLISHVTRLLQTCESLDSRDDVEKILNLSLCILRGSQQTSAKRLLNHIELAMTKLKSGTNLEDIWTVEDSVSVVTTGNNATMSGTLEVANGQVPLDFRSGFEAPLQLDSIQRKSQEPVYITSDHRIESAKLEDEIDQVLQDLRKSQESEYRIAEERLYAQKDFLLGLYQQLDSERSELAKRTSSTTDTDFDALLTNVLNRVNQIKQEVIKLRNMEEISKGFGKASRGILKEHFDFEIED